MFKNIFFDVGNTFAVPQSRSHFGAPARHGVKPTHRAVCTTSNGDTKRDYDQLVKDQHADHSFWWMFYTRLLDESGVTERSRTRPTSRRNPPVCQLGQHSSRHARRSRPTRLRHRIGVISNADGKIEEVLARCGIADCFLTITDSGIVGHEKPHPAIFAAAFEQMKAKAGRKLVCGRRVFGRLRRRNSGRNESHPHGCIRGISRRRLAARGVTGGTGIARVNPI